MKRLIILLLLLCFCMVPKNTFAVEFDSFPNLTFDTKDNSEIKTYGSDVFYSNYFPFSSFRWAAFTGFEQGKVSYYDYCDNSDDSCVDYSFNPSWADSIRLASNHSVRGFNFAFGNNELPFKPDKKYSLLFKVVKGNSSTFHSDVTFDWTGDQAISFSLKNTTLNQTFDVTDILSNLKVRWYISPDGGGDKKNSDVAYLLVEYEISSNNWTGGSDNYDYSVERISIGNLAFIIGASTNISTVWSITRIMALEDGSVKFPLDPDEPVVDPDNPGPGNQDIINSFTENTNKLLEKQQENTQAIKDLTNSINDDNIDDANNKASDFFNKFDENNHGLSGLINAPLNFLNNLTTAVCTPLKFNLPFVDTEVSLPCMKSIYQEHFGVFFTLYQMLTTGLISYAVGIRLFAKVKGLQDPQNDKLEVFSL